MLENTIFLQEYNILIEKRRLEIKSNNRHKTQQI